MDRVYDGGQCGRRESVFEFAPVLEKYGITAVNIPSDILKDKETFAEADRCIRAHGLHWGMLPTPVDSYDENLTDEKFAEGVETLKRWADIVSDAGKINCYNHIWPGSNKRVYKDQREWLLDRAGRITTVLKDAGIRYGFEFLGPVPLQESFRYPFSNNIVGALSVADELGGYPGIVFDTYHWYTGSGANEGDLYLAAVHQDRIVNVHVEDGIAGVPREKQQDLVRAMPMTTGVIDSHFAYGVLKEYGYRGLVMCEALTPWRGEMEKKTFEEVVRELKEGYDRVEGV